MDTRDAGGIFFQMDWEPNKKPHWEPASGTGWEPRFLVGNFIRNRFGAALGTLRRKLSFNLVGNALAGWKPSWKPGWKPSWKPGWKPPFSCKKPHLGTICKIFIQLDFLLCWNFSQACEISFSLVKRRFQLGFQPGFQLGFQPGFQLGFQPGSQRPQLLIPPPPSPYPNRAHR